MFTGIITNVGIIKKRTARGLEISAAAGLPRQLHIGDSISVNGACLTVVKKTKQFFSVDVMPETWKKTMFSRLKSGDQVNLELPLKIGDRLNGHFVEGHVDGTARLVGIKKIDNSQILTFKASQYITRHLVPKGSVAINGISLTIITVRGQTFKIGIIPHTWTGTMLKNIKKGDEVNIETDILAKYLKIYEVKK